LDRHRAGELSEAAPAPPAAANGTSPAARAPSVTRRTTILRFISAPPTPSAFGRGEASHRSPIRQHDVTERAGRRRAARFAARLGPAGVGAAGRRSAGGLGGAGRLRPAGVV